MVTYNVPHLLVHFKDTTPGITIITIWWSFQSSLFSSVQYSYILHHITPCQTSRFLTQYITWIVSNRSHAWHFSQLSQDLNFVSNWCMIGMSHDPHGKSHINDMYCRMTFTWSTYCVQLYLDPNVKDIVTQDQVSDLSVCHMWYDVSSNCHMVDSLYSMISMECHTCLYCCLSRSHYDRMIHCWPSNSGPFVYVGYGRSDTAGVSWRSTWMSCWTWCRWSGSGC